MDVNPAPQMNPSKKALYTKPWFALVVCIVLAFVAYSIYTLIPKSSSTKRLCKETVTQTYDAISDECLRKFSDGGKACTQSSECQSEECNVDHLYPSGNSNRAIVNNFNDDGFLVGKCTTFFQVDPKTGSEVTESRVPNCGLVTPLTRGQYQKQGYVTSCVKPTVM